MAGVKGQCRHTEHDWYVVGAIMNKENWIDIEEIGLYSDEPSPETLAIRKIDYEKLSKEAKNVIETILDNPFEFAMFIWRSGYPKWAGKTVMVKSCMDLGNSVFHKRLCNTDLIRKFFKQKWGDNILTIKVLRELKEFFN